MPSVALSTSSKAPRRRLACARRERWLTARADRGALIVSASRGAADDLARAVALARGATVGLHRFSFAQLAARLAAPVLAARGIAPVTLIGSEAVAARATFDAPAGRGPRLLRRRRRHARLSARARAHAARADDGRCRAARAARAAARRAGSRAPARRASRSSSPPRRRPDARRSSRPPAKASAPLPRLPLLLLDVPMESAVEFELARRLIDVGARDADHGSVRRSRDARLSRDARRHDRDARAVRRLRPGRAAPLAVRRAAAARARGARRRAAVLGARRGARVRRDRAADPRRGARGVRFDEMAVFLRSPREYLGLLEHAFARAGIDAWFDRGTRRPHPSGRAFLALLELRGRAPVGGPLRRVSVAGPGARRPTRRHRRGPAARRRSRRRIRRRRDRAGRSRRRRSSSRRDRRRRRRAGRRRRRCARRGSGSS